jgi:hypothetical protein
MKRISGTKAAAWALAAALLLLPSAVRAQQATTAAGEETPAIAMQTSQDEADREALRRFIGREDVQRVAAVADLDLDTASEGILALEGEQLSRAADQARALEDRMGAQDVISIQATTLIIILLLILLIVVIAS